MQKMIQKIQALFPSRTLNLPHVVSIPIPANRCREEMADTMRLWCFYNCTGAWRPLERWTPTAVRIAFESEIDATLFRLAF